MGRSVGGNIDEPESARHADKIKSSAGECGIILR